MFSDSFWHRFLAPVDDPGSRLFHLNLLIALTMVVIWALFVAQPKGVGALLRKSFFSKRYWFNRSTRVDYLLYVGNGVLKALLLLPILDLSYEISKATAQMLWAVTGEDFALPATTWNLFAISIFAFIWDDFLRFAHHYLMHRVAFLWRWHQVHHSAHVLTPITLYRTHPGEVAIAVLRNSLSLGVSMGLYVFLFDSSFQLLTILGINFFSFTFNLLGANLRHSHVPIGFGPLERIFISPKQHQIHHGRPAAFHGKNFGVSLAIWDQLTRSWMPSKAAPDRIRFGLARTPQKASQNEKVQLPS